MELRGSYRQSLPNVPPHTATNAMTFITTEKGDRPMSNNHFGKRFRECCAEASIPDGFTAHGLRKAVATRIADAAGTSVELMSFGGWSSLDEAEKYIKEANRRKAAEAAARKITEAPEIVPTGTIPDRKV